VGSGGGQGPLFIEEKECEEGKGKSEREKRERKRKRCDTKGKKRKSPGKSRVTRTRGGCEGRRSARNKEQLPSWPSDGVTMAKLDLF
jgi:hypothetical protein